MNTGPYRIPKKTKTKKTYDKPGQPTKFNPEVERLIMFLAAEGMTDGKMAGIIGVTEQTFNNWKKAHPKFFESLKEVKKTADEKVERALYERAQGYSHPEEKIFSNNGVVVRADTTRHYPPDPTSMIFWLKNRQPDKWADKKEFDGKLTIEAAINEIEND